LTNLPAFVGWWEIVGGSLLLLGLCTRFPAAVTCVELLAAYLLESAPPGILAHSQRRQRDPDLSYSRKDKQPPMLSPGDISVNPIRHIQAIDLVD
jgi:hypothetical protein